MSAATGRLSIVDLAVDEGGHPGDQLVATQLELRKGDALQIFAYQSNNVPTGQATGVAPTSLSATMAASTVGATGQTMTVASSTGIVVNDYVRVEDEQTLVTAVPNSTTLTVTRGQLGTQAVAHSTTGVSVFNGRGLTGNYAAQNPSRLTIQRTGRL